jgi:hypothetical protein
VRCVAGIGDEPNSLDFQAAACTRNYPKNQVLLPIIALGPKDCITRSSYPQELFPELEPVLGVDADGRERYRLESSDLVRTGEEVVFQLSFIDNGTIGVWELQDEEMLRRIAKCV